MRFDNAFFEAAFGRVEQLPESSLPEFAFAGRSNVGKSSLINKLFNRKALARVSSTPGKTATVNFYSINDARIVDLPGYGYARVSGAEQQRWSRLTDGYFTTSRDIRMVFSLVDMRHAPTALDVQMLEYLQQTSRPFAIVLTKCDKLKKTELARRKESLAKELSFLSPQPTLIFTSSQTGEGIEQIKSLIESSVKENDNVQ